MMMKKMILTLTAIAAVLLASATTQAAPITQFGWGGKIESLLDDNIFLQTGPSFVSPLDFSDPIFVQMASLELVPHLVDPVPPVSFDFATSFYEDGFQIFSFSDPLQTTPLVTGDIDLTGQTLDVLTNETAAIITAIIDVTLVNLEVTAAGLAHIGVIDDEHGTDEVLDYINNNPELRFNLTLQIGQTGGENIAQLINDGELGNGTTYSATATTVAAVPEPASLSLLGLGGLVMMRRRRKDNA